MADRWWAQLALRLRRGAATTVEGPPPPTPQPQTETQIFEQELPRSPEAPGVARRALSSWYAAALEPDELHRAKLLTSELVTNAVLHGQGQILMRANIDDDRVLVEVIDEGGGFEHGLRRHNFDALHGRGLAIVDAESSRWGIHEGTTHVWFELERPGPRVGDPHPSTP
jgi:anti-sigma regulatory factor (Ser/Thr protein kinase)